LEFTDPQYIDELYDYTTRPRRSILEVLQEFETVKVPWQRVVDLIPGMRGRQFSIASADKGVIGGGGREVELLIAIVKYKTVIKRIREGVCTRYIASLTPGTEITVTIQKGGLGVTSKDVERPVVMVGPGTGIAPMRSLIHQRRMWREELGIKEVEKDLLFFGCRNEGADYFFRDEWKDLMESGEPLEVWAAFSRDQVCLFFNSSHVDDSTDSGSAKKSMSKTWFDNRAPRCTTHSRRKTVLCTYVVRLARCRKRFVKRLSRCSKNMG
jgi:sulfite reductase alpha subunit-like flavoprotein